MDSVSRREQAFQFLEDIEARHVQVLEDLNQLNERIQDVLDQYLASRQEQAQHGIETAPKAG